MFLEKFLKKDEVEEESTFPEVEEDLPEEEEDDSSVLEEFLSAIERNTSQDVDQTLGIVLAKARRITGAEAGSIFITRPVAEASCDLRACSTQNDCIDIKHESFTIAINGSSIAGYVAQEGEVLHIDDLYDLPSEAPYIFNRSFDDKHGYHSTSMLAFPLKNFNNAVIGVVQLINHISGVDENGDTQYAPFSMKHVKQMESVMTILGVMIERIDLLGEINKLRGKY
jgi:hypothetical protein